jgi:hypothetical protein
VQPTTGLPNLDGVLLKGFLDGLQLGEGREIEAQMFNLLQMLIRIPNVQFSTKALLLPNRC